MAKMDVTVAKVDTLFDQRRANGAEGLIMLDKLLHHVAENRDWDALSRFVTRAMKDEGSKGKVVKIIRAAFGNSLTYKQDKTHATGGRFVLGWDAAEPWRMPNTYSVVTGAVKEGKSWNDRTFQAALVKVLPDMPAKPAKPVDPKALEASAKHIYNYIQAQMKRLDGLNSGELLAAVNKLLVAPAV